jgi:hypothetical protein
MPWKRMLAYITGSVNEDLLRRIGHLLEENRVVRHQINKRILLTDHERRTLADKAIALGKLMADTVTIVKPESRMDSAFCAAVALLCHVHATCAFLRIFWNGILFPQPLDVRTDRLARLA